MNLPRRTFLLALASLTAGIFIAGTFAQPAGHQGPFTGVRGQVYRVGGPAQRIDWTPPPHRAVVTILVLDTLRDSLQTVRTDSTGKFQIALKPGMYYFIVKDSFIPREQGPFEVLRDSLRTIRLTLDTGIR